MDPEDSFSLFDFQEVDADQFLKNPYYIGLVQRVDLGTTCIMFEVFAESKQSW